MSGQTEFAGLEELAPGDMLSADGYRFQAVNPSIIDKLLRVGAVTHKHDGHAALANPGVAPTVGTKATGGTIPAATTVSVVHTWVDKHGGETLPSPVASKETAAGLPDPSAAPTLVADYTAGALLAGNWTYALTVTDGVGGETAIGPSATVTVDPGHAKARVALSGLKAILEEVTLAPAAEWRLWRKQEGGAWYLMSTGKGATLDDEGTLPGDCTVEPPETSTVLGTNLIEVTVPAAPGGAEFFRVYICTDGLFTSPCFVAQYPLTEIGKVITFTALALLTGLPPLVSQTFPGAVKIDPDTDMVEWPWKRSVAKVANLPVEGNEEGDVRLVRETQQLWMWDNVGKEWEPLTGHVSTCESHTWAIAGVVTVGKIPGPFIKAVANETQHLLGIECITAAGKVTFTVKHNGAAIGELTGLVAEGGALTVTLAEPLALGSKDTLTLEITAVAGGEELAVSAFVEHIGLVV